MARGITESDVHAAADEIVGGGERPTVERIRAHLGTGSPNTVTKWLETWWRGLGGRLDTHHRGLAIPDAPEAVAGLAGEWWALAIEHARSVAEVALAASRAALELEVQALKCDREAFAAETAALREQISGANHRAELATAKTAELQRLVDRLEQQLNEVSRQRDVAIAQAADGKTIRHDLEARIQSLQDAAQAERESLGLHVRAVEDRALSEIDRARQETKEVKGRLLAASRQSTASEKSLRDLIDQANLKALEASRDAVAQRARADALEGQLGALGDLPAALEAAIRRSDAQPTARKPRSRAKASAAKQTEPKRQPRPAEPTRRRTKVHD
ncbi:DNA-binding protein [Luteimonas fraxinea]|uniref:DNA-binding protein n=1 Tax=Luteimonas fraxinea TaxID=2901869 RepID=A0ABS8UAJ0_9GAMM|nr:DNA-binding protein [Luteimonas fraxinea]MCD9096522.1 DNA-binding protein [Luteimonas fraxinea]MCD9127662.1 DNA-binding protein [Luteimonas fraxinea]